MMTALMTTAVAVHKLSAQRRNTAASAPALQVILATDLPAQVRQINL